MSDLEYWANPWWGQVYHLPPVRSRPDHYAPVPLSVPVGYVNVNPWLGYGCGDFTPGGQSSFEDLVSASGGGTSPANPVDDPPDYGIWMITEPARGAPRAGMSVTIGPSCVGRLIGQLSLDMIASFTGLWLAVRGLASP